jgi:hypothetical protein
MDGLGAMACVKIHREVGTRGLFFALLSCLPFHWPAHRQARLEKQKAAKTW